VTIEKTDEPGIRLSTNLSFLPNDERNIAFKAAKRMQQTFGLPGGVSIRIEKRIPVAAGMAGGSTNCAAVLLGMNSLYDLGLDLQALKDIGVKMGADVPYCIMGGTALSEGIGEILTTVPPMPMCHILVAKPPFSVSTKEVYEGLALDQLKEHPDIDGILGALEADDLCGVTKRLANVLETVTMTRHPEIGQIKSLMLENGAMGALMSGSGPTVFGIFASRPSAEKAAQVIRDSSLARQIHVTRPWNESNFGRNDNERL
jgi:4-diphosphocytidyl-2-C-methyl-D-erythritol kinase